MKLLTEEIDALNMTRNWFGGLINKLDLFVADIENSTMRDLQDMGLLRKKFFGWEITREGKQELKRRNINHYTDTRKP